MIRKITDNEIEQLKKIYTISNNPFELCFVYEVDNKIIGFIDFSDIYDRIELNYIWIEKKYRGYHYSKKLMEYMICYAHNKSIIQNITLEVSTKNLMAINLYEKFNFEKVAIREKYYDGIDGILMIRKFDENE